MIWIIGLYLLIGVIFVKYVNKLMSIFDYSFYEAFDEDESKIKELAEESLSSICDFQESFNEYATFVDMTIKDILLFALFIILYVFFWPFFFFRFVFIYAIEKTKQFLNWKPFLKKIK